MGSQISTTSGPLVHSTAFEEIRNEKRLIGGRTTTMPANTTQSKCAIACNNRADCRSFNYCENQKCELNQEDVYSTLDGEEILQEDASCKYFGMKKNFVPKCFRNGSSVDIQREVSRPGRGCQRSQKRVDREWSPLEAGFH